MYISELPKDVQTIIEWAIMEKLTSDTSNWRVVEGHAERFCAIGMSSKLTDIMYLFEEENGKDLSE